jgi:hypothetical protein
MAMLALSVQSTSADTGQADAFQAYYGSRSLTSSSFNAVPLRCDAATVTDTGGPITAAGPGMPFHHEPVGEMVGGTIGMIAFSNKLELSIHSEVGSNRVWGMTKIGDHVQVCLIARPARDETCNPDVDTRGQTYYVYNYRLKGAFIETTGLHFCGGA